MEKKIAIQAARNFRTFATAVRETIDTVIATYRIAGKHALLHSDKDFDAFEDQLGLRVVVIKPVC